MSDDESGGIFGGYYAEGEHPPIAENLIMPIPDEPPTFMVTEADTTLVDVLAEVAARRENLDHKWRALRNEQDGTGEHMVKMARLAREGCDEAFNTGRGSWCHVLAEDFAWAMAQAGHGGLRSELINVAAVAVAWIEDLDRRGK